MRTTIVFLLCIVAFCFITIMQSSAQDKTLLPGNFPNRAFTPYLPGQTLSDRAVRYKIAGKRASQYTADDWGTLIDSTWGPGQTAAQQLKIFDDFWTTIDQQWAGFPNLAINWDSLRTVYRPQIGSGLSRGRFYALMSRIWLTLTEYNSAIMDTTIESIFSLCSYYGITSFHYRRGVPLLCIGSWCQDMLGAAVTPMPDSSNLVYRVAPGNPLGLEPGDLVLGYEGIPWKRLYRQLLDAGLPVSCSISLYGSSFPGTTPESMTHAFLSCVGRNWGMFDTIDVVKFSTGDTLHLPTAPLATVTPTLWASDQVPIAGVQMPQAPFAPPAVAVSWGVVQGTNIGYIYVWDWNDLTLQTSSLFQQAIYDLFQNKNVSGLVIDFRMNWGTNGSMANAGLWELLNVNPYSNLTDATRNSTSDHFGFSIGSPWGSDFIPAMHPFERPIAVLIGPGCVSGGENVAYFIRSHPMARFFGKPTNGAFIGGNFTLGSSESGWLYQIPTNILYSFMPGEGYLIHKGFQPDEEVWLTRDGVAQGKDDVVERALAWITTLTYAHDVTIDRSYVRPHSDSVSVTATLANPLNHTAALSAIVTDYSGVVRDSILLHGDGQAADSVWGCRIPLPSDEDLFKITVRTDDITQGSYRKLPNIAGFATAGPLTLDSVGFKKTGTDKYFVTPYVRNNGSSFTIHGATVTLLCDPWVTKFSPASGGVSLPDLPPGMTMRPSSMILIYYDTAAHPTYFNLKFDFSVDGVLYWTDSTKRTVTGVGKEDVLPVRYALDQNYPNPFNPTTVISYQLPVSSHVTLKVYDLLGREVATLVNERKDAGVHEVTFDGSKLASGVYFYRLQAGDFVQTKKFVLLR